MKRLLFTKLYLLSLKEQTAKIVHFHPNMTIIRGKNSTGKSSLVKMLYQAMGASVPNIPKFFQDANVISLLYFTVDGEEYSILKHQKRYLLFHGESQILSTQHVTDQLAPEFAKVFNFKLCLNDKKGNFIQAPPAFLFLPFYLDQDQGWHGTFKSFDRLGQFENWTDDFISFHLGITSPEYYERRANLIRLKTAHADTITRYGALDASREDILKRIGVTQIFDFDVKDFGDAVEKLMIKAKELKQKEDKYLDERHALNAEHIVLNAQKNILEKALEELRRDFAYSARELPDEIECPFCHSKHQNSFAVRFGLAVDSARCEAMLVEIGEKISTCGEKLIELQKNISAIDDQKSEIQKLLQHTENGITLEQVIKSSSRKEIDTALNSELRQLREKKISIEADIQECEEEIKKLIDKERKKRVLASFESRIKENYKLLNMPEVAAKQHGIRCECPKHSGSDKTRIIFGYFLAFISTIEESAASCMCPIVIDSPKQSDLDSKNWDSMLKLLKSKLPIGSQCILSVVEHSNIDFEGDEITLDNPWHLLTSADYKEAHSKIMPLLEFPDQQEFIF